MYATQAKPTMIKYKVYQDGRLTQVSYESNVHSNEEMLKKISIPLLVSKGLMWYKAHLKKDSLVKVYLNNVLFKEISI